ncbi:cytokinin dehydrogenase 3-like protein [Tanacetum coccineum]|uniref:Cytokinin dehydrogenase 3-like protein n=1 Tax=Tanacetum coccineum TaxID=301880 RepID=A0ABQ5G3M4_9ASTR
MQITHLCFADNLLVFCHGDIKSVSTIKESLKEFSSYSGLKANMNKSTIFFGGLTIAEQSIILDIIPFAIGSLPVRYLGVPLITKKICATDCKPLIDKVKSRIMDWRNKALSYSGRLQLIVSVLSKLTRGKAKVSWGNVCKPKEQGGLGIKDLELWNESNSSTGWKDMLKLRDKIRKHVLWKVGDGKSVNVWYDNWNTEGALSEIVSTREMYDAGMSINTTIADLNIIHEGKWPEGWEIEYPILKMYKIPSLHEGRNDEIVWVDNAGHERVFGVKRSEVNVLKMERILCYVKILHRMAQDRRINKCIPRHAFVVWMAIQNRLNTQDRIALWKPNEKMQCVFCKKCLDSIDHLFFICEFSKEVWREMQKTLNVSMAFSWENSVKELCRLPNTKNIWSIIRKLVFGAVAYFIWQEMNKRIFKGERRDVNSLVHVIMEVIRLKLAGMEVKESNTIKEVEERWSVLFQKRNSTAYIAVDDYWLKWNGAWIFESKREWVGRGVKKKDLNRNKKNTSSGTSVSADSDDTMNDDTPIGVASVVQEGVTPSVVDMTAEIGNHNSLDDTTVSESFPPLSTPVNTAGNAPGKSSYANITSKPSGKKMNVRTLFTHEGNGIDVVVLVDFIRAISARFANTAYGFFLGKKMAYPVVVNYVRNTWVKLHGVPVMAFSEDGLSVIATKLGTPLMLDSYTSDMCMQSWGRSSYARVRIELRADMDLKDNIVVAMPKITREGHYTCNVRVEYEWKPPRCSSCKVFGYIHEGCPKNKGVGEKKTVKKLSQTSRGVSVFGNKKKCVKPAIEVSNSNPFDILNSVDNDVEFGTNGGTTNLVNNEATSSGSSFMNIDNDGEFTSNTPICEKIDKIERQICEGKLRLLDNDVNPLVPSGIVESDSEVEMVFDETSNLRISTSGKDESDKGYGTNSLLEQWRDSYQDNDDYDPYDDDMYENHDLSEQLQSICDDLNITVRGRKKK